MTTVLISCPVYKREWILPTYFEYIEKQDYPLDKIGFIFELGPDDDATHQVLSDWSDKHPELLCFDGVIQHHENHETHPEDGRFWNQNKYLTMVTLRNNLLERATELGFDRFFSLDSDLILEEPDTISKLVALTEKYEVVSPLSYMTPFDDAYPSVMSWFDYPGGNAIRHTSYPIGTMFESDIVMAAIMMVPEVYKSTRYRLHHQGEDLGFATELYRNGFKSHCASHIYLPHIMIKPQLQNYKQKGDPRKVTY